MKIPFKHFHWSDYAHRSSDNIDTTMSLAQLLQKIKDGDASTGDIASIVQRPENLENLSPREGQKAIEMLARGYTNSKDEKAIAAILEALSPEDRGEALRLIEGGGDRHSIKSLLSKDIDNKEVRKYVSRLIEEARPYMSNPGERLIVSDIDDTVKPWKDKSVSGPVFPGVKALYRALDLGVDGKGDVGDVHFIVCGSK